MSDDPILLEWIERAIGGDESAFEEIYYTYKDDVYTACMRMLGTAQEAEDAAQDVFIRLLRVLPRYDHTRASFRTWMLTITTNYCYDQLRKRRAAIQQQFTNLQQARQHGHDHGGLLLILEHQEIHLNAEATWLTTVIEQLETM